MKVINNNILNNFTGLAIFVQRFSYLNIFRRIIKVGLKTLNSMKRTKTIFLIKYYYNPGFVSSLTEIKKKKIAHNILKHRLKKNIK